MAETDLQMNIFGAEVPLEQVAEETDARCTRTETCRADAADHFDDCPVEQRLREDFGY